MILSGKTIGQLALSTGITSNSLFAIEQSGKTFHIPYSGLSTGGGTYEEVTYDELYSLYTGGTLVPGGYYLITDFQTCYDQPNYDNTKTPITTGNYKTGTTEPILLLAVSTTGFSPTVYSTLYPQDKITYDITWDTTEVTNSPAKGRITERIDELNNRTDYDHRTILFKRYNGYSYDENSPLGGLVGISGLTGTTGVLYGNTGTTFTSNFLTGSIVSVRNLNPSFFEIISVESDSIAIISGVTINETTDSPYYFGNKDGIMSYYQPNVSQDQVFEYTTFGDAIDGAVNNYIGNQANLFIEQGTGDFILANNVFLDGAIRNNTIGNGSYNNTFNDDCDNNQIGDSFYNNSTDDDFDGNIIGENFNNNYITSNFNNNRIGSDFEFNILLGGSFYRNNIGNDFRDNVYTNGDFQNNEIGNQFNNNKIYNEFYNNDIGNGYNNNESYSSFYRNLIGNGYNGNTIYSQFYENNIEHVFENNIIGTNSTIGTNNFSGNRIGNNFSSNTCDGFNSNTVGNGFGANTIGNDFNSNTIGINFQSNTVGINFQSNNIGDNFTTNAIGNGFNTNTIGNDSNSNTIVNNFQSNNIGSDFNNNTIGDSFYQNTIGDSFYQNTIGDIFEYNTIGNDSNYNIIGNYFNQNTIGNDFYQNTIGNYFNNNTIVNNFQSNNIGSDFNNNTIGDSFYQNTIVNDFRWNTTKYSVASTDFLLATHVYADYNCEIFRRSDGTLRLSYYDSSDVLNITNITA